LSPGRLFCGFGAFRKICRYSWGISCGFCFLFLIKN
jgi:hypothetical protein